MRDVCGADPTIIRWYFVDLETLRPAQSLLYAEIDFHSRTTPKQGLPPQPQCYVVTAEELGLTPKSRKIYNRTLAAVLLAEITAMASIPAGKTVLHILHGLDGGSSDLSVLQELTDCLEFKILMAIEEAFKRLGQDLLTNTALGQVDFLARMQSRSEDATPHSHRDFVGLDQIRIESPKIGREGD